MYLKFISQESRAKFLGWAFYFWHQFQFSGGSLVGSPLGASYPLWGAKLNFHFIVLYQGGSFVGSGHHLVLLTHFWLLYWISLCATPSGLICWVTIWCYLPTFGCYNGFPIVLLHGGSFVGSPFVVTQIIGGWAVIFTSRRKIRILFIFRINERTLLAFSIMNMAQGWAKSKRGNCIICTT